MGHIGRRLGETHEECGDHGAFVRLYHARVIQLQDRVAGDCANNHRIT